MATATQSVVKYQVRRTPLVALLKKYLVNLTDPREGGSNPDVLALDCTEHSLEAGTPDLSYERRFLITAVHTASRNSVSAGSITLEGFLTPASEQVTGREPKREDGVLLVNLSSRTDEGFTVSFRPNE